MSSLNPFAPAPPTTHAQLFGLFVQHRMLLKCNKRREAYREAGLERQHIRVPTTGEPIINHVRKKSILELALLREPLNPSLEISCVSKETSKPS